MQPFSPAGCARQRFAFAPRPARRADGGRRTRGCLSGTKPWPPGPPAAAHPIPLAQRVYMVAIFTLTAALLYADQNLMAPNLTAIAREFHFNDEQRDRRARGAAGARPRACRPPSAVADLQQAGWGPP